MTTYTPKTFTIPELPGLSAQSMATHLKLYEGYVKHTNLILEKITELSHNAEANAYAIAETQRRFGFEFNGMKNHEYFFAQFEIGSVARTEGSELEKAIASEWGSFDAWLARFKSLALTRGIGWAMLYRDRDTGALVNAWIDEQHLGQLNSCDIILALDMWEHSYFLDYAPAQKNEYVDAVFANLNWPVVERRFAK